MVEDMDADIGRVHRAHAASADYGAIPAAANMRERSATHIGLPMVQSMGSTSLNQVEGERITRMKEEVQRARVSWQTPTRKVVAEVKAEGGPCALLPVLCILVATFSGGVVLGVGPLMNSMAKQSYFASTCRGAATPCSAQFDHMSSMFNGAFQMLTWGTMAAALLMCPKRAGPRVVACCGGVMAVVGAAGFCTLDKEDEILLFMLFYGLLGTGIVVSLARPSLCKAYSVYFHLDRHELRLCHHLPVHCAVGRRPQGASCCSNQI